MTYIYVHIYIHIYIYTFCVCCFRCTRLIVRRFRYAYICMMTKWAASNLCSPKCGQGEEAEPESPIGKVSLGAN